MCGHKFRRQVPIGDYVVDFVCENARLVIEADGGQHADLVASDDARTQWLNKQGYRVMRFWNNDVLANPAGVLETIIAALDPLPAPLPRERGNT
jgi:very-short-patch-repair endonuclease